MKFQTMLLAISAVSTAVACPTKSKPKPTSTAVTSSTPVNYKAAVAVETTKPSADGSDGTSSSSSSTSGSSTSSSSKSITGKATFYGGNLSGGTCSFTTLPTIPNGMFGTAYSGAVWDNGAMCGACVEVTGPNGNSIKAMVVDKCPECDESHLDLFQDGFLELGTASQGIIDISYKQVDCGTTAPLVLHNKSGTSAYWFSMQVVGANGGVDALDVSTDGGSTWQSTTRKDYNFFENASGFGVDTVTVRVTGASGATVTVEDVSVASDSETTASGNV